jgi:hypothetical protein
LRSTEPLRIARTESLFRDVNERIAEAARNLGSTYAEFVCECVDPACGERFAAHLEEYEAVRADGRRFLVAPGHEEPRYERVIEDEDEHHVVQKDKQEKVARKALKLDPRAGEAQA